ncbi:MAG: DNA adenine methylase [Anaerolineae bacterium]|nr:DNA adenine methylase [Anaerolineae bacterium]
MSKSPLRYPGGKSRAVARILAQVPATLREYREPFIGGASVLLAVQQAFGHRLQRCWMNDLNYDLVCFWRYARDEADRLADHVQALRDRYADGRQLYAFCKDPASATTDFDRAARFFILNRITFSGVAEAGGFSASACEQRFTPSSIERLRQVAHALHQVEITHGDYESLLLAPGDDVFIFLDPPYLSVKESRLYGQRGHLHTGFDHERFAALMQACPHRWLITYDDAPAIRELFAFANITPWQLQYGMNNYRQGKASPGQELFISNG